MIAAAFLAAAMVCDGVTDDTAAWADAVAQASTGPDKVIELQVGTCVFKSQPAALVRGASVHGMGKGWSGFRCDFSNQSCIRVCDQSSVLQGFYIHAGAGAANGIGLDIRNCGGRAAGNHVVRNVWITSLGGGTWWAPLYVAGTGSITPPGVRALYLEDVTLFNNTGPAAVFWTCHACEWRGGGAYAGAGNATYNGTISVGGGSTNLKVDALVDLDRSRALGWIQPGTLRP